MILFADLIQEHHYLDIDVVKGRVAEWLRRCGDRISNELRKRYKKHQEKQRAVSESDLGECL